MQRKYVKVFEELDNSEFENPEEKPEDNKEPEKPEDKGPDPDEDDKAEEEDDKPMTAGELRAYNKGLDIMTEEQLAALYIKAQDRLKWAEETRRVEDQAQLTVLRDERRTALENGDWTKATYGMLARAMDMKERTITRTVRKFKMLINPNLATDKESMYPKLTNAFEKFREMQEGRVKALADAAIDFEGVVPARRITKSTITKPDNVKKLKDSFMKKYAATGKDLDATFRQFIIYLKQGEHYDERQVEEIMPLILKAEGSFMLKGWTTYLRKLKDRPAPAPNLRNVTVGRDQDQTER